MLMLYFQDFAAAGRAYRRTLEHNPCEDRAWFNYGILLAKHLHEYEEAARCYQRATELDPGYAKAWYQYAVLLQNNLHDLDQAERCYKEALACGSDGELMVITYGYACFLVVGVKPPRLAEALELMHRAQELGYPDAAPLIVRIECMIEEQKLNAGIASERPEKEHEVTDEDDLSENAAQAPQERPIEKEQNPEPGGGCCCSVM